MQIYLGTKSASQPEWVNKKLNISSTQVHSSAKPEEKVFTEKVTAEINPDATNEEIELRIKVD